MFWSSGPRHWSIEAAYPVTMSGGGLAYHANPNVVMVMVFLNILKKRHPILVLPTISSFLNAADKSQKDWAFNAADNLCSIYRPFHLGHYHQRQLAEWSGWDNTRLKEMVDTVRTGILTPKQQEQLDQYEVKELFNVLDRKAGIYTTDITKVYNNMKKIAAKYTISPDEFDELCFIDSPSGSRPRVFYPFWHRSRDLAKEVSWDWSSLFDFANWRLSRLRRYCNRYGEKAKLSETDMDRYCVVYWMTHWICDKIRAIKDSNETGGGLPIVPWQRHIFGASLCKKNDHGIAMLFGLVSPPSGVAFDPVNHFDLRECTIEIDSYATNFAMGFSSTDYWPKLLALLRTVPVQTPLWRMEDSLGMRRWVSRSKSTTTSTGPRPPVVRFTMPLLDSSLWMSD
ncbi:hypothetical protein B0H65DRAFT_427902, partial [Neurospora tetraspora]